MEIKIINNKLSLLFSVFNRNIFSEVKRNIGLIKKYILSDKEFTSNPLSESIINLVEEYPFDKISEDLIYLKLDFINKTEEETNAIKAKILHMSTLAEDLVESYKEKFRNMAAVSYLVLNKDTIESEPFNFIKHLNEFDYKTESSIIKPISFSTLIKEVKESGGEVLSIQNVNLTPSPFKEINECFPMKYGFIGPSINMIIGPPASGKSLLMMDQATTAVKAKKKVAYFAFGDLKRSDFLVRMPAIEYGVPLKLMYQKSHFHYIEQFEDMLLKSEGKLEIIILPAEKLTPLEFVEHIKSTYLSEFDDIFIDYDSNFKTDEYGSLYEQGSATYNILTELVVDYMKNIFIASQPGRNWWSEEIIPREGAAESSRKIHVSDSVLTIGRYFGTPLPIGKLTVAKNRRGEENSSFPYIRTNSGKFVLIDDTYYGTLKGTRKKEMSLEDLGANQEQISNLIKNAQSILKS